MVRGELGWERQKTRFDELRLRYWAKILRMTEDRLPRMVHDESRVRLEREEKEREESKQEGESKKEAAFTDTWCTYTRDLLSELQLGQAWAKQCVPPESVEQTGAGWNKFPGTAFVARVMAGQTEAQNLFQTQNQAEDRAFPRCAPPRGTPRTHQTQRGHQ